MMLCHGTRVGETRKAQWSHISIAERTWYLPVGNTKTRVEHSLPLTEQVCGLLIRYRELKRPVDMKETNCFGPTAGSR